MTTPVLPYGLAPYVSPAILNNAPTGIDFSTIPDIDSDPQANNAEMWNMCMRATAQADGYCNQILRATLDTELLHGPDYRVTVGPASGGMIGTPYWGGSGATNARLILSRWPILEVTGVKICPNGQWPRSWTSVTSGYFEPETPPIGIYGTSAPSAEAQGSQAILVGGGAINWTYGRNGYAIQVSYINGWPHTSLTADAAAGAMTLTVNDVTGWAVENYYDTYTGATGVVYDGGTQESIQVTAVTPTGSTNAGPGTLTLSSALQYPHETGAIVTTLPLSVQKACIFIAAAEALTRGATSTTIQSVGGRSQSSDQGSSALITEAELLLHPYRRTI